MKLLTAIFFIIIVGIYAGNRYLEYQKFNPGKNYNYTKNDSIDINYYNQSLVNEYYKNVEEIGSFARKAWFNEKVDVLFEDEDRAKSSVYVQRYNDLKSRTKYIEDKLTQSYSLKARGFNNYQIQRIEIEGYTPSELLMREFIEAGFLREGVVGKDVYLIQKKLQEKGYALRVDGKFRLETSQAVTLFQKENELLPNGEVDIETYKKLMDLQF